MRRTSRRRTGARDEALPGSGGKHVRPASTATVRAWVTVTVMAIGSVTLAACGDDGGNGATGTAGADGGNAGEGSGTTEATGAGTGEPVIDPGDDGRYDPQIDPADFVTEIDNPYLPLRPGSRWVYEGIDGEETERVEVEVTTERREVMGVSAVVVRDTVTVDGELVEDTFDWFAQDREGNVWYLGEDTTEYEGGEVVSTEGSWEAGVDRAQPGIVMPAAPAVGQAYRQEYYRGEAEDMGEVLRLGESVTVPAGSYDDVLVTQDWTPLEPEVVEEKSYAPNVGLVLETKVAGGTGRVELISYSPGR